MPEQKEDQTGAQASAEPTPGGGLRPRLKLPIPVKNIADILGGLASALTAGGTYIAKRPHAASVGDFAPADVEAGAAPRKTAGESKNPFFLKLKGRTVSDRNGPQAGPGFAGRIR